MTKETKHLWHWWFEWLKRFLTTTYHIVNRRSYHKWKNNKNIRKNIDASSEMFPELDILSMEDFH